MLIGAFAGAAGAAQWEFDPTLTLAETYSDNISLAPAGQEVHDFITQVSPGIGMDRDGQRIDFTLDYLFEYLLYARNSNLNTSFHQLEANARAEVIDEFLFLDGRATIDQALINGDQPVSSNLTATEDLTDVGTVTLSPYIRQRLSDLAIGEVRYRYDRVLRDDDVFTDAGAALSDSDSQQIEGRLASSSSPGRTSWALHYQDQDVEFDTGDELRFQEGSGELRYLLTPSLTTFATGGYEDNDFMVAPGGDDPNGAFWSAGLSWSPSPRTTLEGAYGDRFFGETFFGRLSHNARRSVWQLEYREDVTSAAEQAVLEPVFIDEDLFGQTLEDSELTSDLGADFAFNTEAFVEKRLDADVAYQRGRSVITLNGFTVRRELLASADIEKRYGGGASWEWRFGPRTRSVIGGEWQRETQELTRDEDKIWEFNFTIIRRLGRRLEAQLEYTHFEFDDDGIESTENIATIAVEMRF